MMKTTIFLLAVSICLVQGYQRYDNYKIVQIVPKTPEQLNVIKTLQDEARYSGKFATMDFWREPSGLNSSVDVMVHPMDMSALGHFLDQRNIHAKIVVDNVQRLVEEQKKHVDLVNTRPFKKGDDPKSFSPTQYNSIDDINNWMDSLAKTYPDIVSTFSIGSSHEKRDMRVIKIGSKGTNKPGFWLDAGIHAREWIAVSTAVYIINELVTKYSTNPSYKDLVDKVDFYLLPSANPDGYEYTRSKNRMWRKTRGGPYGLFNCVGADPNRNFDMHWMEAGASSNPCSDTYAGPKPFSEVETQNMATWLKANKDSMKAYITLHSYSDLFMYGYGYADHTYPEDVEELKALAHESAAAIKATHGTTFSIGSPPDILYAAAGGSDDWAKAVAGIKWSYALELRPGAGDTTPDQQYGFALPPSYITPVGEEVWSGLQVVAKKLIS